MINRNGGESRTAGNVLGATAQWFVDAAAGNLRLARPDSPAIGGRVRLPEVLADAAGEARAEAPAAGAFEYRKN